jgi:hypothetical protein
MYAYYVFLKKCSSFEFVDNHLKIKIPAYVFANTQLSGNNFCDDSLSRNNF